MTAINRIKQFFFKNRCEYNVLVSLMERDAGAFEFPTLCMMSVGNRKKAASGSSRDNEQGRMESDTEIPDYSMRELC